MNTAELVERISFSMGCNKTPVDFQTPDWEGLGRYVTDGSVEEMFC